MVTSALLRQGNHRGFDIFIFLFLEHRDLFCPKHVETVTDGFLCLVTLRVLCNRISGGLWVVYVRFSYREIFKTLPMYIWRTHFSRTWVSISPTCVPWVFIVSGAVSSATCLYIIRPAVLCRTPGFSFWHGTGMGTFKLYLMQRGTAKQILFTHSSIAFLQVLQNVKVDTVSWKER